MDDDDQRPPHLLASLDLLMARLGSGMRQRSERAGLVIRGSEARLLHLIGPEGTRQTDLADGAWISKQAIGKRIREMQERGLVIVAPDPADRRATLVRRTPAGDAVRAATRTMVRDLEDELAGIVGRDRYRVFRAVADELATITPT
jgi:DNA-binding MarR family transcriptional regulator